MMAMMMARRVKEEEDSLGEVSLPSIEDVSPGGPSVPFGCSVFWKIQQEAVLEGDFT